MKMDMNMKLAVGELFNLHVLYLYCILTRSLLAMMLLFQLW